MNTYIALLRGINVGGHRKIKMADLKGLFESLGFQRVQTYIQSGNVVFETAEEGLALGERIEGAIEARCGFPVTTVLRSAAELDRVVADCPFAADRLEAGGTLYVFFLAETPAPERVSRLPACENGSDEFRIAGREIYLLCRRGMSDTSFTNSFFESKLGVPSTARNWQTTVTLMRMAAP